MRALFYLALCGSVLLAVAGKVDAAAECVQFVMLARILLAVEGVK